MKLTNPNAIFNNILTYSIAGVFPLYALPFNWKYPRILYNKEFWLLFLLLSLILSCFIIFARSVFLSAEISVDVTVS